jgi:hypothetical protein
MCMCVQFYVFCRGWWGYRRSTAAFGSKFRVMVKGAELGSSRAFGISESVHDVYLNDLLYPFYIADWWTFGKKLWMLLDFVAVWILGFCWGTVWALRIERDRCDWNWEIQFDALTRSLMWSFLNEEFERAMELWISLELYFILIFRNLNVHGAPRSIVMWMLKAMSILNSSTEGQTENLAHLVDW